MPMFEFVAVVVTLTAVYLTTREVIWCWPLGLISVTMYAAVFYEAKLYADMGLQGLYFILSVYGWWSWARGSSEERRLEVSRAPWSARVTLSVIGAGAAGLLGVTLSHLTDASLPFMDSALTSFSIVAQFMAARKWIENWMLWIIVDLFYVGMFLYKQLFLTAGLYAAFLVLAALGLASWRRSLVAAETGASGDAPR
jgi:nicotinamide mononucleotide transporter